MKHGYSLPDVVSNLPYMEKLASSFCSHDTWFIVCSCDHLNLLMVKKAYYGKTYVRTDRQADRQTDRQTDRQIRLTFYTSYVGLAQACPNKES